MSRPRDFYYRFGCGHSKRPSNRVGSRKTCRICTYRLLKRFNATRDAARDAARPMTLPKPPHLRRTNKHDLTFAQAEDIRSLVRRGFSQKSVAKQFRIGQEAVRDIVHRRFLAEPKPAALPKVSLLTTIRAEIRPIAPKRESAPIAGRSYETFPPKQFGRAS